MGKMKQRERSGIVDYFRAQKENLGNALRFEPYAILFPLVDQLYSASIALVPRDKSPVFGKLLLICHKSFLAAASLIGQAQPDDAAPITRRAIEVVALADAIKTDRKSATKWAAFEDRMKRWQDRQEGKKPKSLKVHLEAKHPNTRRLMETRGILSDAAVHFTPEFFGSLDWKQGQDSLFLNYFTRDQRTIEREIVSLVGIHVMILQVFNWCFDNVWNESSEWRGLLCELEAKGKPYAAQFEPRGEE